MRGSRVLVLGVAYKGGVGDLREAPALKIIRLPRELGAEIAYHDPHVPELPELGLRSGDLDERARRRRTSPASSPPTPRSTTSGSSREAQLVVDFRGVTRGIEAPNLVRL